MSDEYVGYRTVGLVFVGLCVALGTGFALKGPSDQGVSQSALDDSFRNDLASAAPLASKVEDATSGSEPPIDSHEAAFEVCMEDLPRVDTSNCIADEIARQDDRLNEAYQNALPTEWGPRLRQEQRLWLQWVDMHCELEAEVGGLSVGIAQGECRLSEIEKQADYLEKFGG